MHPISGLNPDAARPLAQAAGIQGAPQDRPPREQDQGRPLRPAADEYTPEQKEPPSGRYWLERDGDGRQVVFYDGPQQPAGGPARPETGDTPASGGAQPRQAEDAPDADAPQPGKAAGGPEEKRAPENDQERCTVDTGRVDREIEALKKQKQELERQLKAETDETKARALRARVAQIEQELSQKDNDTYRRQHAEYSFS